MRGRVSWIRRRRQLVSWVDWQRSRVQAGIIVLRASAVIPSEKESGGEDGSVGEHWPF